MFNGEYNNFNYFLTGCSDNSISEYVGLRPHQIEQANITYNLLKNKSKEEILTYRKENIKFKENLIDVLKYFFGFDNRRAYKRATDRVINELDGKTITVETKSLEGITNDSLGMNASSMLK